MVLWRDGLKSDGTIQTSADKKRKALDSGATQSKKADAADKFNSVLKISKSSMVKTTHLCSTVFGAK